MEKYFRVFLLMQKRRKSNSAIPPGRSQVRAVVSQKLKKNKYALENDYMIRCYNANVSLYVEKNRATYTI